MSVFNNGFAELLRVEQLALLSRGSWLQHTHRIMSLSGRSLFVPLIVFSVLNIQPGTQKMFGSSINDD